MLLDNIPQHHSATVQLFLVTTECQIPLAQLGPDFVIVRQPFDIAPCDAEIVMRIDDSEDRWPVRLVDGLRPADRRAAIASR